MPSRDERHALSVKAERALRALAFALIAFAWWRMRNAPPVGGTVRVSSASLARDLPALEAAQAAAVHVELDSSPLPAERDALAAIARAGTRVTWSGRTPPPLAAVAARSHEPGGPVRVEVASPADVTLSDAISALDTVRAASAAHGAAIGVGAPSGGLVARSGSARAPVGVPPAAPLRPVLVVGRAGWEAKFTVAALEEQGWPVEERLFVAPGADVTQGATAALDTSRYSAIVALDTTLGSIAPSITRFVREGGGLVLLGSAAAAPAVRAIAPARPGARTVPSVRAYDVANPVTAMPLFPLEALRADAVTLAARGAAPAMAARREGAGRVLQVGFDESWRWRMQGGAGAVAAHRAWWSRIVASVAARALPPAGDASTAEGAPLARLVDALGPPIAAAPSASAPTRLPAWLLPLLLLTLLAEWGSRRWRGAQ